MTGTSFEFSAGVDDLDGGVYGVPTPSAPNPQRPTINNQPSTLNPQPLTLKPEACTLTPQPQTQTRTPKQVRVWSSTDASKVALLTFECKDTT